MIATVLAGTGDGLERLRAGGAGVELRGCKIEVVLDEPREPRAHVVITIEPAPPEGSQPV
jgi:hypothetical protein